MTIMMTIIVAMMKIDPKITSNVSLVCRAPGDPVAEIVSGSIEFGSRSATGALVVAAWNRATPHAEKTDAE